MTGLNERRQVWCANELMKLTMRKRGKRVSFLSWLLGWVAFSMSVRPLSAQDSEYNTRVDICASDGVTLGYDTLEELNLDIQDERTRIEGGGEPFNPYLFTLCPQTVFDAEGNTIVPSLNNILIGCGAPPVSTNQCIILNGDMQVDIGDFLDTDIPVQTVRLSGMTFSSFTGSAIAGGASSGTRVELFDTIFKNFQSSFVVLQQTAEDNPVAPFEVQLRSTTVINGTAGTFFANDGGVLRIVDMTATNVNAAGAFISTEGAEAATFLSEVDVSASDINEIFTALNGADLDASEVKVSGMTAFRRIFSVSGSVADPPEPSRLALRESEFSGNSATAPWVAVDARNNAAVTVTNTTVSDNDGAEHLFSASQSSSISLQKVDITNTFGALPFSNDLVSTVGFANTNSEITWTESTWTNVAEFTAGLFAVFESNINAQQICIDGTRLEAVVFVSYDSTYSEADNFIQNLESDACPEEGLRLAKENAGGGCFDPDSSSECSTECQPFATAEGCLNIAQMSAAPTTPGVSTAQVSASPSTLAPVLPPVLPPMASSPVIPPVLPPTVGTTLVPTTTGVDGTAAPTGADGTDDTARPSLLRGSDQPSSVPTDEASVPVSVSPTTSVTTTFPTPPFDGGNETGRPSDMPSQLPTIVGTTVAPSTNGTGSPQPSADGSNQTSVAPTAPSTGDTTEPSGLPGNATSEPTIVGSAEPTTGGTTEPPASEPPASEPPASEPPGSSSPTGSSFPTSTPRDSPTGSYAPGQESPYPTPGDTPEGSTIAPVAETAEPSPQVIYLSPSLEPSQTPTFGPSPVLSSQPSTYPSPGPSSQPSTYPSPRPESPPSSGPSLGPSLEPSTVPSIGPTALPSSTPSVRPTASPTTPKPTGKCRERPIVVPKGKGVYVSSSESKHHKSKKHDKHHHHKSEKSKKKSKHYHRKLQNGIKHRLYEKEGRQNNLLLPKQGTLHERLLKKSKKDKGKGKGYEYVQKVIVIQHPPPDDDYWDLPFCD